MKLIPKVDLIYEYKNPKYGPGPSTSMGPNIRKFVFPGFFIGFFLFLAFFEACCGVTRPFRWTRIGHMLIYDHFNDSRWMG